MRCVRLLPAVLLGCAGVSALACDNPPLVQVPAAKDIAGREELVQIAVSEYVAAMQVYTDCIKAELDAAGGDSAPQLQKAMLIRRNNLAVSEVEAVLKLFEAAIVALGGGEAADSGRSNDRRGRDRDRERD